MNKANGGDKRTHRDRDNRTDEEYMSDPTPITKYRPSDFIVPASDHLGHSERMWFRAQPSMDRALDVVIRSKRFPFHTKGDIMRWATHRGLKELEKLESNTELRGFLGQAEIINDMLKDEEYWHQFSEMFSTLDKVTKMHIAGGAHGEAMRLVAQTKAHMLQIAHEPFWQNKCLEELQARFGHLMKGQPKVSLHGHGDGGANTNDRPDESTRSKAAGGSGEL